MCLGSWTSPVELTPLLRAGKVVGLSLALFFAWSLDSFAQQDPQFTQNMYNRLPANPGYAGSTGALCASTAYRMQWVGFDGAPVSGNLSVDGLSNVLHGGLGLNVLYDKIGAFRTTAVNAAYAYRMRIGQDARLAFGLSLGMLQTSVNGDQLVASQPDPFKPINSSAIKPDFGFGVYFNTSNYYFGLAVNHLTAPKLDFQTEGSSIVSLTVPRHFYFMAGYNYDINQEWTLKPSVFIKSANFSKTQVDFNLTALYNNLAWAGVTYRIEDAIALIAGVNITNELKVGYSYDITMTNIAKYSNGSHEILLKYCFDLGGRKPSMLNRNVRFL